MLKNFFKKITNLFDTKNKSPQPQKRYIIKEAKERLKVKL